KVSSSVTAPTRPTGTISVREVDRELASAVIDQVGQALAVIPSVSGGSHVIQAAYTGDANFAPSTQSIMLTVRPAASSISLACQPNPAGEGEIVHCTVRAIDIRATGTVNLRDGSTVVNSATLTAG